MPNVIDQTSEDTLDFTVAALEANDFRPHVAGNTWSFRLQLRDEADHAVDLTGAKIKLVLFREDDDDEGTPVLVTRRSDTEIASTGVFQIAIDDDQTEEQTSAEGLPSGTGWFQINFLPDDQAALLGLGLGLYYEIRYELENGTRDTYARGRWDVVDPAVLAFW